MNRTDSYVMTVYPESAGDMLELENIRKAVKIMNKTSDKKFYVKCQGRFGKNNPNLYKYRNYSSYRGVFHDWRICKLADAQRWDVYIYERYDYAS